MQKFLTEAEVYRLIEATEGERHATRDACLLLWMFRRGWRASEACAALLDHVKDNGTLVAVPRLKGGVPTTHPLDKEERAALRAWLRAREGYKAAMEGSPYIFVSERGKKLTREGVRFIVERYAAKAGIAVAHPHMLRHACGYALANDGHDTRLIQTYLGHSSITSTQIYTETNPERFVGLWEGKGGKKRK